MANLRETVQAAAVDESDPMKRLRRAESDAARLRVQLQTEQSARRHAESELAAAIQRQGFLDELEARGTDEWNKRPAKASGKATAVVVLTDWHVEERVEPRTIGELNEFNLAIASKRIKTATAKACELIDAARMMSRVGSLVVALLGDMITGYIHEELVEGNYLSPIEATLFAQDHIASSLAYLQKYAGCKSIEVVCCHGNHGRTGPKKKVATSAKNSYEWLMYKQLERTHKAYSWRVADGYRILHPIQGKTVRFHHGDGLKYQGGVGGITIPVLKAIAAWNQASHADLDVFGHWHQFLAHRQFVASNCLIGYGPYSEWIKAQYAPPSQTLIVIDRDRPSPVLVQEVFCD